MTRENRPYTFFKITTSTCPQCMKLIQAKVIFQDNRVYFLKYCPDHGTTRALVSEDAKYYQKAYSYSRAGSLPHHFSTPVKEGCPQDCGLCPDHQQHTCLSIIEITDHCNLDCPICIVDNHHANHMTPENFEEILQLLIKAEGSLETIAISGGEPTMHPQFFDLVDLALKKNIGRVAFATNGLRLAQDREFCQKVREKNLYVILQLDGFSDDVFEKLRGRPLLEIKQKALANLEEFQIPTQIIFVPVKGVNDHQLGEAVKLLTEKDHILCLMIQPVSYSGQGGGNFPFDPEDRLTTPGVIKLMAEQSGGLLNREDFIPLPCSHPLCVSLTYLLKLNDGSFMPFSRFVDLGQYTHLFEHTAALEPTEKVENALQDAINNLWSAVGEVPDCDQIRGALKRALLEMYPEEKMSRQELIQISERQAKSIFIHHYMDAHDFDVERLIKCCHHYVQVDGRIMPACGFNMFHRGAAIGADSPKPEWGKGPFQK